MHAVQGQRRPIHHDGGASRASEPQVVVFTNRQRRVEPTHLLKQRSVHHHGRRPDHAVLQQFGVAVIASQLMLGRHARGTSGKPSIPRGRLGIVTDPNMPPRAGETRIGKAAQPCQLPSQLAGQPEVIRVAEGEQTASRFRSTTVSSCSHTGVGLVQQAHRQPAGPDSLHRSIARTVIDDEDLQPVAQALRQQRAHGRQHVPLGVVAGDDDGNFGIGHVGGECLIPDGRSITSGPFRMNLLTAQHTQDARRAGTRWPGRR